MKKRYLIFPLFLGSFFITSNVDSAVFELYYKQNNNLLIVGGDCGGGGKNPIKKKGENLKKAKKVYSFLKVKKQRLKQEVNLLKK